MDEPQIVELKKLIQKVLVIMVLIKRLQYFQISASRSYTCISYVLVLY